MPLEHVVTGDEFEGYTTGMYSFFFGDLEAIYAEDYYLKTRKYLPELEEQLECYKWKSLTDSETFLKLGLICFLPGCMGLDTIYSKGFHSSVDLVMNFGGKEILTQIFTGSMLFFSGIGALTLVLSYRIYKFYHQCNSRLEKLRSKNESQS